MLRRLLLHRRPVTSEPSCTCYNHKIKVVVGVRHQIRTGCFKVDILKCHQSSVSYEEHQDKSALSNLDVRERGSILSEAVPFLASSAAGETGTGPASGAPARAPRDRPDHSLTEWSGSLLDRKLNQLEPLVRHEALSLHRRPGLLGSRRLQGQNGTRQKCVS